MDGTSLLSTWSSGSCDPSDDIVRGGWDGDLEFSLMPWVPLHQGEYVFVRQAYWRWRCAIIGDFESRIRQGFRDCSSTH